MKPQSHLTRRLFRALIANQPYHAATCPLRAVAARRSIPLPNTYAMQRRGLFGLSIGSAMPKELTGQRSTPKNVENALVKLSEYIAAKRHRSRPPPHHELADALKFLVNSKTEQQRTMTRSEVYLATETLNYLIEQGMVLNNEQPKALKPEDLKNILQALVLPYCKEEHRSDSVKLADLVLEQISSGPFASLEPHQRDRFILLHIAVLASSGSATRALELFNKAAGIEQHEKVFATSYLPAVEDEFVESQDGLTPENAAVRAVVSGLYAEHSTKSFWELIRAWQTTLPVSDQMSQATGSQEGFIDFVIRQLCARGVPTAARDFWTENIDLMSRVHHSTTAATIIRSLVCSGNLGPSSDDALLACAQESADIPEVAAAVLLWHAAAGYNISQLTNLTREINNFAEVTMDVVNPLVEYAYSKGDPRLAEQFVQMGDSLGAMPDAQTFAHKLNYDLSTNNLPEAQSSFESLSIQDTPDERIDIPVLNKYITKLASTPEPDLQLVMRVVDRVTETDGSLNADSLAALSAIFLQRRELDEAMNVLRYRIEYLPSKERAKIAQVFKDFIVDPEIKDQRAFDAYELFRAAFAETPPSERLLLMDSFFDRKRSDLACLVFGHMRQQQEVENRPDDTAYARCFYGIARCRDVDGLQMIYNMLKMDIFVEQTTKIHNAMMAAYAACQTPFTAIIDHYWKILDSREGPTLSTFKLALRACETWIGAGGEEARRIMALMQKWNMVITKDVYDCYIGALAGQSQFENVIQLIENMHEDIGEAPDATTIGTFYNAIPWQYRKDEVEAWARRMYPDLWEELVSYGDVIDEEWEVRYFNVNREIEVDDDLLYDQGQYTPQLAEEARLGLPAPEYAEANNARP